MNGIWSSVKGRLRDSPAAVPFQWLKSRISSPRTQNDEAAIIRMLVNRFAPPKLFVEFGFGGWEFNCAPLVYAWSGMLLDGDAYNVMIARLAFPSRVVAKQAWITRETLDPIFDFVAGRPLGILSIDVDGNDYWLLEALIGLKPAIIIAEYNSTFQDRSITIPYDPAFDYRKAPHFLYHGASLAALSKLAVTHGYSLIAVGSTGINSFFVRNDLLDPDDRPLDPATAYRELDHDDGLRASDHWEMVKHLPFVEV